MTYKFLISLFSFIIILSFFLPWFSIEQFQTGVIKKIFTEEGVVILELSGFNIPLKANGENASFILSLAKIFSPGLREFAYKSWLLWLLPCIAFSIAKLSKKFKKSRIFNLYVAILGLGLSLTAGYRAINLDLDKFVYRIELKEYFWITILSFFAIGVLGLMQLKHLIAKKPKR